MVGFEKSKVYISLLLIKDLRFCVQQQREQMVLKKFLNFDLGSYTFSNHFFSLSNVQLIRTKSNDKYLHP